MTHEKKVTNGFDGLGIAPRLLEVISKIGFTTPTPIQHKAIPVAIEGGDMIGIAQTGTGKTLAFGIPMLQRVARQKVMGLVVLPTRELALQVEESLHMIGERFGLRTAVLIGGASMSRQHDMLKKKPHIIVATPGRLIDHLDQRTLALDTVGVLVLDEADRMLDMGFMPQVRRILKVVPKDRQTMLFSATMPDQIVKIADQYMRSPVRVEVARAGTTAERVEEQLYVLHKEEKMRLLDKILAEADGPVLVFSRTKHGARRIARGVKAMGHSAADIHSDRSLAQRRDALDGFKSGKYRVLVATDIAARGIDVSNIEIVVNYDVPENSEDYVHRIGRTGRAGKEGLAISFATPDQGDLIRDIEKLTRKMLPITRLPELPPARPMPMDKGGDRGGFRGRGRFGDRPRRGGPSRGGSSRGGHRGGRRR